jgi:hypothetical protein
MFEEQLDNIRPMDDIINDRLIQEEPIHIDNDFTSEEVQFILDSIKTEENMRLYRTYHIPKIETLKQQYQQKLLENQVDMNKLYIAERNYREKKMRPILIRLRGLDLSSIWRYINSNTYITYKQFEIYEKYLKEEEIEILLDITLPMEDNNDDY